MKGTPLVSLYEYNFGNCQIQTLNPIRQLLKSLLVLKYNQIAVYGKNFLFSKYLPILGRAGRKANKKLILLEAFDVFTALEIYTTPGTQLKQN